MAGGGDDAPEGKRARVKTNFFVKENSRALEAERQKRETDSGRAEGKSPQKRDADAGRAEGKSPQKKARKGLVVPKTVVVPTSDEDSASEAEGGGAGRAPTARGKGAAPNGGKKATAKGPPARGRAIAAAKEPPARGRGNARGSASSGGARGSISKGSTSKGSTSKGSTSKGKRAYAEADSDGSGWATGSEGEVESDIVDATCHHCKKGDKPEKMLLCDTCDRGWHLYCLNPPLKAIPSGDWSCPKCVAKGTKRLQQESDPKSWSKNLVTEQEDDYDSAECEEEAGGTAVQGVDMVLTQPAREALHELSNMWELASVVHFIGVFGLELSIWDGSEALDLPTLAAALRAEDAASQDVLAKLHVGLLNGSNLTRTVPLDDYWWPLWLAKWVKRRAAPASDRHSKIPSVYQESSLQEDEDGAGGANYNDLRPAERLRLLHLLCCDRLEAKRPMLLKGTDAPGDHPGDAARDAPGDDGATAGAGMPDLLEGDVDGEGCTPAVPSSWRPTPVVVDSKGRRYWHFREAKGLQTCLFRSSRYKTPAGKLQPLPDEKPLAPEEEKELWASCTGAEMLADVSEDEDGETHDKCEVCDSNDDPQHLMLCDMCDEAYHTYCLRPVLKRVPAGEWTCPRCDASGQSDCPEKHTAPIARGLEEIETSVHIFWESLKKGETDGLVMERIVTKRPKKAIGEDRRTFDVHYCYKRTGGKGKKSSGIFRSLPEVHRHLNSLWLLAEEHLGRFDFSCCYDAEGTITDFGRQRLPASRAKSNALCRRVYTHTHTHTHTHTCIDEYI